MKASLYATNSTVGKVFFATPRNKKIIKIKTTALFK